MLTPKSVYLQMTANDCKTNQMTIKRHLVKNPKKRLHYDKKVEAKAKHVALHSKILAYIEK